MEQSKDSLENWALTSMALAKEFQTDGQDNRSKAAQKPRPVPVPGKSLNKVGAEGSVPGITVWCDDGPVIAILAVYRDGQSGITVYQHKKRLLDTPRCPR